MPGFGGQIYNLIVQRDNQLAQSLGADSREIAAATKMDSTAMKGLTAVAILFLPGTFFAVSPSPQHQDASY